MKPIHIRILFQTICLLLLSGALTAQAQTTYIKANNTTALNTSGSWTVAGFPGSGDIGRWDSTVTAANTVAVGGPLSIGEILIANPGGAVSISDATAANILTLNGVSTVGVDMSVANQNLTFAAPLSLGGSQTWNLGSSARTLTLSGANGINFGANVLTISGGGLLSVKYNSTMTTAVASSAGAGVVLNNSALGLALVSATTSTASNPFFGANCALTFSGNCTMTITATATTGNHSQSFTTLTLNPGTDILTTGTRGSSSGISVGFTAVSRNAGSMVDDQLRSGTTAFGGSNEDYAFAGSGVLGYLTFGQNDWMNAGGAATINTTANAAFSAYTTDDFTTPANNVNVTVNDSPATFTVNSLRFNTAGARTLTLTGVNTITSGGILVGSTVGANAITITGDSLTSGNVNADATSDLIVINNNTTAGSSVVINSVIADGAGPVGLTAGSTTAAIPTGSIQLGAANTFSGKTYITKGTLQLNNALALQNSTFDTTLPGTLNLTAGLSGAATFGGLSGSGTLALPSNFALTLGNNNTTSTFNGALTGAGATVTKTGTGVLTLNAANSYTGLTTINQGTLALGASGSAGGATVINSPGILDVSAAGTYSLAKSVSSGNGAISGNVSLAVGGQLSPAGTSGTLTLNNNLTLNGGTCLINMDAGLAQKGTITVTGTLTINSGTIQLNITDGMLANGTYKIIGCTGTPTGSGSLLTVAGFSQPNQAASMVANAGELDLVVVTYFAQNLTWVGDGSANLWNVNSAANWNDTGPTPLNPSVFHNGDYTVFDNSSANTTVNLSGTLSPLSVTVNGTQSYTFGSTGTISGGGTLADNSSGTLTVLTANNYSGGTTIGGGATIQVGNGTTTGAIGTGPVVDNSALIFNIPDTQSMGAASGTGTLAKQGAGTLVLNGADTLAGDTTVTAGTLKQGAPSVLPNGTGVGNTVVNGTLDMAGLSGTVNGLSGASSGIIDTSATGSPTLTVTGNGTFSGVIKNTAGSLALNMNGSGKQLTLGGVNTYSGSTTVTAGTLQQGVAGAIPGGSLSVAASANLDLNGSGITVDGLTGGGTIDSTAAGTMTVSIGNSGGGTFSGAIKNTSGTVNFVKNGVGALTLSGASSFTGAVTDSGGTLTISGGTFGSATSDIEVGNGVANVVFSITGGTVTARNFNIADLANSTGSRASITGTASATFNAVNLASAANTGSNLIINTIGTVALGAATFNRDSSGNSSAANTGGGLIINNGTVTATSFIAASTTAQRPSDLNLNGGSLTISAATGGFELATSAGNGFLTQTAGTLSYLGSDGLLMNTVGANVSAATISGGTATLTGITLNQVNAASAVTSSLTLSGGATLYLGSVGLVINQPSGTVLATLGTSTVGAIADWSSSAPITLTGTPVTFQAANSSAVAHNITLSGILSGAGSLTKTGNGTLTLSGPNTYSGAGGTIVSAGTLLVNNTTGSGTSGGTVTVQNTATLGGTGTIGGATTLQANTKLAPGDGVTLNVPLSFGSTLSLDAAATSIFAVNNTAGGAVNKVAVTGALTPSGSTIHINNSGAPLVPGTYPLFTYSGGVSGPTFNATPVFDVGTAVHPASIVDNGSSQVSLVVPNATPVANSFTLGATIGTQVSVPVVGKFATDADSDALTLTIATPPANGTAVVDLLNGSNIIYTAISGTSDSFTYTATDPYGAATTGTVTVTINQTGQSYNMLTAPVLNNGKVTMSFLGIPKYKYALDWTHSLTPPVTWLPVVTNTAAGNGILLYTNTPSGGSDFYRTRYTP